MFGLVASLLISLLTVTWAVTGCGSGSKSLAPGETKQPVVQETTETPTAPQTPANQGSVANGDTSEGTASKEEPPGATVPVTVAWVWPEPGLRGSILLDPQSGQYEEVKDIIGWYFSLPSPDGTRVLFRGTGGIEVYDTKFGLS